MNQTRIFPLKFLDSLLVFPAPNHSAASLEKGWENFSNSPLSFPLQTEN